MKKILLHAAAFLIGALIGCVLVMLVLSAKADTMYVLAPGYVKIRSQASTHGEVYGKLHCGDMVETTGLIGEDIHGDAWYRIPEGWVYGGYLVYQPVEQVEGRSVVTIAKAPVYGTANGTKEPLDLLIGGTEVHVIAQAADWTLIDQGYIETRFLHKIK